MADGLVEHIRVDGAWGKLGKINLAGKNDGERTKQRRKYPFDY